MTFYRVYITDCKEIIYDKETCIWDEVVDTYYPTLELAVHKALEYLPKRRLQRDPKFVNKFPPEGYVIEIDKIIVHDDGRDAEMIECLTEFGLGNKGIWEDWELLERLNKSDEVIDKVVAQCQKHIIH